LLFDTYAAQVGGDFDAPWDDPQLFAAMVAFRKKLLV
jgi:hypothetical protein